MTLTLLAVGPLKTPWIALGAQEYIARLKRAGKFEVIELPASRQKDAAKQREEESARIGRALQGRGGRVWVLDERGEPATSEQLAQQLGQLKDAGESLTLVVGGAYGFTPTVRECSDRVLKLSDGTLPHELARLVLLEQLYRADQIRRGTGYHH